MATDSKEEEGLGMYGRKWGLLSLGRWLKIVGFSTAKLWASKTVSS